MRAAAIALALILAPILAQIPVGGALAQEVAEAPGAALRALDKVSGQTTDIDLRSGETGTVGRIEVSLGQCRYPVADPASNAYARLTVRHRDSGAVLFDGWMIAASPALSALDDPRYDVWVLRCTTP
ncbi:MAG: DUF2155 domain-containing protein [Alphaproteobacteria bacterium HGW-Alphaproteobacteria-6]|nr:MAG: DUF2155 domain-containing protein [Alphaproteobacteria bacterium HGW-Alphaproteobacteria-6]